MRGGNEQETEWIECWQMDGHGGPSARPTAGRYSLLKHSDASHGWRRDGQGIHQDNTPMAPFAA